ncbi:MAG: hypothetical protein AAGF12_43560, partial [Myxococcota bacterium]
MRLGIGTWLIMLLSFGSRTADAQDRPLLESWSAPAECPPASTFEAAVVRLLGGELPDELPTLHLRIQQQDSVYDARLRAERAGENLGERLLSDPQCAVALDAAALVAALMIDPEAVVEQGAPEERPLEATGTETPETPISERTEGEPQASENASSLASAASAESGTAAEGRPEAEASAPSTLVAASQANGSTREQGRETLREESGSARPPMLRAGVGAIGDVGSLPRPAGGLLVRASLRLGALPLRVAAHLIYLPPVGERVAGHPTAEGDLQLIAGGLAAEVVLLTVGPLGVDAFLGAEVGA